MWPRIHAVARRRDRRQILLGACCSPANSAPTYRRMGSRRVPHFAYELDRGGHEPAVTYCVAHNLETIRLVLLIVDWRGMQIVSRNAD